MSTSRDKNSAFIKYGLLGLVFACLLGLFWVYFPVNYADKPEADTKVVHASEE